MLPGIRILFAIVLLSVSVLIFGLGAAAFLRSAHENIASAPLWKPIETPLTARVDIAQPTLAMLRVEPEPQPVAAVPAAPAPVERAEPVLPAAAVEAATVTSAPEDPSAAPAQVATTPSVVEKPAAVSVTTVDLQVQAAIQPAPETPAAAPQQPVREATVAPAAAEPKPEQTPPTVLAAVSTNKVPAEAVAAAQPPVPAPAPPVEASTALATEKPTAEKPAAEKPAVAASTDTLKADDKALDGAPTRIAALTEPAADQGLAETKPLPAKEVKLPQPRVDPAIREAHHRKLLEQQRARTRAAQARRLAAARARNAAQARANAAATTNNPFGLPQPAGAN